MARTRRLIVDQFDPHAMVPGGTDTCIHDLVKYGNPAEIAIAGVTRGELRVGEWHSVGFAGREIEFFPLVKLDRSGRRRIPHSARVAFGMLRYRRHLKRFKVVQTHRIETGMAAQFLLRPGRLIQFLHNDGRSLTGAATESLWRKLGAVYRVVERWALKRAAAVVLFSRTDGERIQDLSENVHVETTWYDPALFSSATATKTRSGEGIRVAIIGRLERQKDPDLALAVIVELHDRGVHVDATFAGDGSMLRDLVGKADLAGITGSVHFVGAIDRQHVAELMAQSDVLLLTSHYEGSPRVMIEAGASGLPVVATTGADPDSWLNGRNGFSSKTREAIELARLIEGATLLDPADCKSAAATRDARIAIPRILGY